VAGLGLVRVAVEHKDGTSHLVLQGLARVALGRAVRYKPYRVHRVQPLATPPSSGGAEDALLSKVRELLRTRLTSGAPLPVPFLPQAQSDGATLSPDSAREVLKFLNTIADPEQAADMVSCAVLGSSRDRQAILETPDVPTRLRRLIRFLQRDIRAAQKGAHE
jgi:Lon protease-like protein